MPELTEDGYNILVAGIGGTGVLTIGALLGMAAHLDRKGCTILDLTGMAQKGGSVTSHIRVGPSPDSIYTSRLSEGMTNVLIACDMIVGSGSAVLKSVRPADTACVLNTDVTPTGDFQSNKNVDAGEGKMHAAILDALAGGALFELHATQLATALTGDTIGTNVLMLGYAAQKGLLPVSMGSIEQAIRLNGTFVEGNLRTFALGRLAAHAPDALASQLGDQSKLAPLATLDDVLASRTRLLTAYQDAAYAASYVTFVADVRRRIDAKQLDGGGRFVREVALTLARLMAYKDEYEVARLYTDPAFKQRMREQFSGNYKMTFHLAPPLLPGRDASGRPKKRAFGTWVLYVFKILTAMRRLRGTPFDILGYMPERRMERQLVAGYRALILDVLDRVNQDTLSVAIDLAAAASEICGYGPVKQATVAKYQARRDALLAALDNTAAQSQQRAA